jgi:tetratricopeptide (TPR) repeat protein
LRQALADDTQSLTARHNLARLLARRAPSAEAEQLWRQNLTDDPTYLPSRFALAAYLERNGRLEESAAEYQTALGTNASDGSSGLTGTRELLSDVYVKLRRLPDAISALTPALKENPGIPRLLEKMGDLHSEAGETQLAEQAYKEALGAYRVAADQNRVRKKLRLGAVGKTAK